MLHGPCACQPARTFVNLEGLVAACQHLLRTLSRSGSSFKPTSSPAAVPSSPWCRRRPGQRSTEDHMLSAQSDVSVNSPSLPAA